VTDSASAEQRLRGMFTSRTALFLLTLFAAACSPPVENSQQNAGGAGNSTASSGAAGTATSGGGAYGGGTPSGGAAGAATGTGGAAGTGAGAPNNGGAGAGTAGGAGTSPGNAGIGNGGAGNGGDGTAGMATSGTGGSVSGGASGSANGGASGSTSGGRSAGGAGAGGRGTAGTGGASFGVCNGAAPPRAVSIYVVGDSTASVYASDLYPRMGWGQPLQDLFATQCAVVHDVALSGRSSKSFIDEGAWTPVRNALASGDIVLIQFGHNDEKTDDPARYTEPQTTFKQYLTTYITDTRAKQATPILLTPINRNSWSGTTVSNSHGAYPDAMRELATSLGVSLIDMTAITKQYFERIGQAATADLFLILAPGEFPNYPDGNTDNTHFQEVGARKLGQLVAYDAYRQRLTLASFLKAVPAAP
jgi:lysophospholipase L1-like esterase